MRTKGKWEKRWHSLREEWVVYSAHRNSRPWQGAARAAQKEEAPEYDASCYLCPGNKRIHGNSNPHYKDVFIFENDHPVVGMDAPEVFSTDPLYRKESAQGVAKVVCYDPRHNITLSQMKLPEVVKVFSAFQQEMIAFQKNPAIHSVLIFENKGEVVGVSNPHPHCQVYAVDFPLKLVSQQIRVAEEYKHASGRNIFEAIVARERKDCVRIIAENDFAIAFIPYFARYAYEVMIFPKGNHQTLITLSPQELTGFTQVFHQTVRKLDMNFQMDFPYVMSMMQAPVNGGSYPEFRMHGWLQPPYRQPGLIKYLAGPEIGAGNFMADTMPEDKAAELQKINVADYSWER
ncbi:MAG: galactose-1-phosphate uridylyltransferase [Cyclobacteriaceae bacterium]|nr:galactose-1-phosphate uridylyltransferase [Cyclobacteriaceae bacterium]